MALHEHLARAENGFVTTLHLLHFHFWPPRAISSLWAQGFRDVLGRIPNAPFSNVHKSPVCVLRVCPH